MRFLAQDSRELGRRAVTSSSLHNTGGGALSKLKDYKFGSP